MVERIYKIIPFIFGIISLVIGGTILYYIQRGFELSDNGYYAVSILQPGDMFLAETRAGTLLWYLFVLIGENMVRLRVIAAIILMLSQGFLTYLILYRVKLSEHIVLENWAKQTAILISSLSILMYYTWSMNIPSYNWTTLLSILWMASGFILWRDVDHPRTSLIGVALVGVGFGVLGWSKITTALIFVGVIVLFMIINYRHARKLITLKSILAGSAGVLFITFIVIIHYLPLDSFVENLLAMYRFQTDYGQRLSQSFTMLSVKWTRESIIATVENMIPYLPLIMIPSIFLGTIGILGRNNRYLSKLPHIYLSGIFIYLAIKLTESILNYRQAGLWVQSVFFFSILIFAITLLIDALQNHGKKSYKDTFKLFGKLFSILAILWAFNYFFAFGTNNLYIYQISLGGGLFILGVLILAVYAPSHFIKLGFFTAIIISFSLMMYLVNKEPYRQEMPLWEMNVETPLRYGKETVLTSQALHDYLTDLQDAAQENGFVPGTPVLDFTGHVPHTVYALDGRTYGIPWFLGGRNGSRERVMMALALWEREHLDTAWLLTPSEPGTERAIDMDILDYVGLDFDNFEFVVEVVYPYFNEPQTLWRPRSVEGN